MTVSQFGTDVLPIVKSKGIDIITWKPQEGMCQAHVITKTKGSELYYVASGRSLNLTEQRIALLGQQLTFWGFCSVILLFVVVLGTKYFSKPE